MLSTIKILDFIEFVRFESKRVKLWSYGHETLSIKFFPKKRLKKKWRTGNVPNTILMKFEHSHVVSSTPRNLFFQFNIKKSRNLNFIVFSTFKSTNPSYFEKNGTQTWLMYGSFFLGNRSLYQVEYPFETLLERLKKDECLCGKIQKGNGTFFIFTKFT